MLWLDIAEQVDPRVRQLVDDQLRLVVLDDPRRQSGLARLPWLQVLSSVHAERRQRLEQPRPVDHLDGDAVVHHELPESLRDLVEDGSRVERREDGFGDFEQVGL